MTQTTLAQPWSDAMLNALATLQRLAPQDRAAVLCEAIQCHPAVLDSVRSLLEKCYP